MKILWLSLAAVSLITLCVLTGGDIEALTLWGIFFGVSSWKLFEGKQER